jgi:hypothetical protein
MPKISPNVQRLAALAVGIVAVIANKAFDLGLDASEQGALITLLVSWIAASHVLEKRAKKASKKAG